MRSGDQLTGQVYGLEASHIVGSQFIDGSNAGGRQNFLQEVAGPQTPHQAGELALSRWRPHIPVHRAQHRRVGRSGAARCTVDVVKLEEREERSSDAGELIYIQVCPEMIRTGTQGF